MNSYTLSNNVSIPELGFGTTKMKTVLDKQLKKVAFLEKKSF